MKTPTLQLDSSWDTVKERIKEVNVNITDEDLQYQPGEEQQMLERLSKKMSMGTEDLKAWIESVSANKGKAS